MSNLIELNDEQAAMLRGQRGLAKQMGMRLLLDLAATAGARAWYRFESAHLSGVSPLTGGLGLRRFLARLAGDEGAQVAVPTTLNSAGCDEAQFAEMRITAPDFKEHNHEIVALYTRLGVRPTQSCTPYEWEDVVTTGRAAWAESNAICFGNSYCDLLTNRESGLSALASALTGYAPYYGLLTEAARRPNLLVQVTTVLHDPTDYSILGDWIGKQRQHGWDMPYGPIPAITGLPAELTHEEKKALSAAAANYGCPLLYLQEQGEGAYQGRLLFGADELATRYEALRPRTAVSLITLGCPQASLGELRAAAHLLDGQRVTAAPAAPGEPPPLWLFTSSMNLAIAEQTGLAEIIRGSGALLLENTCPEVVPYDQTWVKHILTNSMKAEHYIKSGLNGIPTSVMTLADCIDIATGKVRLAPAGAANGAPAGQASKKRTGSESRPSVGGSFTAQGQGLPSQTDFHVRGRAFVSPEPVTFLGYVDRESGVVEEQGHPRDGESMAGCIAIFPKGSGSSVAPYVLLELFYRDKAPLAIINTEIDQQSAPACSLEGIPYAFDFDADVIRQVNHGDLVEIQRRGGLVTLRVIERVHQ